MELRTWRTGWSRSHGSTLEGPDIRLTIDGKVMAEGLDRVIGLLPAASRLGNSYRLLAPVAEYRAREGDLYVELFVEVVGRGHPQGDPIVSLMQIRDGKVIRQSRHDRALRLGRRTRRVVPSRRLAGTRWPVP